MWMAGCIVYRGYKHGEHLRGTAIGIGVEGDRVPGTDLDSLAGFPRRTFVIFAVTDDCHKEQQE